MSFEEEFDKIIRQKSEEAEYPFDENNWANASALIESDKKAAHVLKLKKVLKPAIALTVAAVAVLLAFTYLDQNTSQSDLKVEQINENSSTSRNTSIQTISNAAKVSSEKPLTSLTVLAPAKKNQQVLSQANTTKEKGVVNTRTENSDLQPVAQTDVNMGKGNSDQSKLESNEIAANEKAAVLSAAAVIQQAAATSPVISPKEETTNAESALIEESTKEVPATVFAENQTMSDHLSGLTLSIPYESTTKSLEVENQLTILNYDEAYFKQKRKTHYLNVEAGIAYLTGWNTSSNTDGKGLDYFGGFNYGIYLNNKFSIGIGVQAYNLAHMNDPYYSSSHKEYDFGSTTIYTVVTCTQLYYAAIPLKINYVINKFNKIGIGFNAAYAFNSDVNTESYSYSDNVKMQSMGSSGGGIYDGMNQYNYMLTAHYSLRFAKRLNLNVEAVYGLTDIFNNTTEISNSEKTSGIRLSLGYTLFDK